MTTLFWLDLLGVAVFAASGALVAARHRLDLLGALVVAFVSALGGGTLRDVLLGLTPVFWVKNTLPGAVALSSALLTFVLMRFLVFPTRVLLVLDAVGLGVFAVLGANRALEAGVSPFVAAPMGMLSGAAGGAIRDVLCGEIPTTLKAEVYATAALFGAAVFCALTVLKTPENLALFAGAGLTFALRIASLRFKFALPIAELRNDS